jgi:hypothetical protein
MFWLDPPHIRCLVAAVVIGPVSARKVQTLTMKSATPTSHTLIVTH